MSFPQFAPPWYLNNAHLQAVLSSSKLRRLSLSRDSRALRHSAQWREINTDIGVTLAGEFNAANTNQTSNRLIVLMHGWEGSSQSNYVVSAANHLNRAGFDTFRLNFRDHGNTYALNHGIFNSSRIDEVVAAIDTLQRASDYTDYGVMGFSLGGNFALRVGLHSDALSKPLAGVYAVSPVIDPAHTMKVLNRGPFWYERYFAKKWAASLDKKQQIFPDYKYGSVLKKMKSLDELNQYFIPRYTNFDSVQSYFQSYTLSGKKLRELGAPTLILAAEDDPVIPVSDFALIEQPDLLTLHITTHGSHCAYLENLAKPSFADRVAAEFFSRQCSH